MNRQTSIVELLSSKLKLTEQEVLAKAEKTDEAVLENRILFQDQENLRTELEKRDEFSKEKVQSVVTKFVSERNAQAEVIGKLKEQISGYKSALLAQAADLNELQAARAEVNQATKILVAEKESDMKKLKILNNDMVAQTEKISHVEKAKNEFEAKVKVQAGTIFELATQLEVASQQLDLASSDVKAKETELKKLLAFSLDKSSTQSKTNDEKVTNLTTQIADFDNTIASLQNDKVVGGNRHRADLVSMSSQMAEQKLIISSLVAEICKYDVTKRHLEQEVCEMKVELVASGNLMNERHTTERDKLLERCGKLEQMLEKRHKSEVTEKVDEQEKISLLGRPLEELRGRFDAQGGVLKLANQRVETLEGELARNEKAQGELLKLANQRVETLEGEIARNEKKVEMEGFKRQLISQLQPGTPVVSARSDFLTPTGMLKSSSRGGISIGVGSAFHQVASASMATSPMPPVVAFSMTTQTTPPPATLAKSFATQTTPLPPTPPSRVEELEKCRCELESETEKKEQAMDTSAKWQMAVATLQGALDSCTVSRDAAIASIREERADKSRILQVYKDENKLVNDELKLSLKEAQSHHDRLQRELVEIAASSQHAQSLSREVERMNGELNISREQSVALESNIVSLKTKLVALNGVLEKTTKKLKNAEGEIQVLERSGESNKVAYLCEKEAWEVERERLEGEVKNTAVELEKVVVLKEEVLQKLARNDKLISENVARDKQRITKLEQEISNHEAERRRVEREVLKRKNEMSQLQQKLKRSELKMRLEVEEREMERELKREEGGARARAKTSEGAKTREGSERKKTHFSIETETRQFGTVITNTPRGGAVGGGTNGRDKKWTTLTPVMLTKHCKENNAEIINSRESMSRKIRILDDALNEVEENLIGNVWVYE